MELLVKEDGHLNFDPCEKCIYRGYTALPPEYVPCNEVHGCGRSPYTYFLAEQL